MVTLAIPVTFFMLTLSDWLKWCTLTIIYGIRLHKNSKLVTFSEYHVALIPKPMCLCYQPLYDEPTYLSFRPLHGATLFMGQYVSVFFKV